MPVAETTAPTPRPLSPILRLWRAQLWRTGEVGLGRAAAFAVLGGLVITTFGVLARFAPGALTSATRRGLEASAEALFPSAESSAAALGLALLWIQGPALLVLFSSMPVSNFAAALSGVEVSEGKAEYLLAGGWTPRQIALATMLTVGTRSVFIYLCMAAAWLLSATAVSWGILAADLHILPWRDSMTFALCGGLLSLSTAAVVSLSAVRWPNVSSARFGSATGISTLGALPGLLVLAAMTMIGGGDLRTVVVVLSCLSTVAMAVVVALLTQGMTRRALL
jgi:hypothetical protein